TGLHVSEVSFGAHGTRNAPLLAAALHAGYNLVMTSGSYLDGREEEAVGEAIASAGIPRERVVIATGEMIGRGTGANRLRDLIDASLRRLHTEYIDVFYVGAVESPEELRRDALHEAIDAAKRAGKVKHLGLSAHTGRVSPILDAAIADGRFGAFFIRYDFMSDPDIGATLRRAAEKGIGVAVFKTNAGARQGEIADLENGGLSFAEAAAKWALTNPDVASVLISIRTFDQIRSFAAATGAPLTVSEAAMLRRYARVMDDRVCRFCRTCEAACPHGVAVADVNRFAMYFTYYGREKEAMGRYRALPRRSRAAECASCDAPCEAACPHARPVRAELAEAHRRLTFARG
ncbi:MAG: aldo/keto reductase, partial [Acidobacteriota bacterium]